MLKVMIIDDEYYFREALKIMIPWNDLGFQICNEARNGEEALEMLDIHKPDILLVDINMPVMNGLSYIEEIKDRGLVPKIIIISGYEEFSYAKQAVEMGVYNYLLKPVNPEELKQALNNLSRVIIQEKNMKLETEALKVKVRESMPLLKVQLVNDLLHARITAADLFKKNKANFFNIDFSMMNFQVISVEIDDINKKNWSLEDQYLLKFAVSNITSEILSTEFLHDVCYDAYDRICAIISYNGKDEASLKILSVCDRIRLLISKFLNFTVTIGVGNRYTSSMGIHESYKESFFALKNRILGHNDSTITFNSVSETQLSTTYFPSERKVSLLMSMRTGNINETLDILEQIFKQISQNKSTSEYIHITCIELISTCMEFLTEHNLSITSIYNGSRSLLEEIQQKKSIIEIKTWIIKLFSDCINSIHQSKKNRSSKIIIDVKKYIEHNYQTADLRLEEIAKSVYVNPQYLSFLFKKEMGQTVIEYLTSVRLNKAKELMDNCYSSVPGIAEMIGYMDPNYFSKCFKKKFGVPPSKYIESKTNN